MKLNLTLSILVLFTTTEAAGLARTCSAAMKAGTLASTAMTMRTFSQLNNHRTPYVAREAKELAGQSLPDLFAAAKELFWEGAAVDDVRRVVPGLDSDTLRWLNEHIKAQKLEQIDALYYQD